ncbi:hypothetical protein AB0C59_33530, partial [Streptomyces sp. NPDC048664]|uniref:hypothetical protein n=1 Tax=Streptomyces sp. NPDC048664 TaxID=3154505 RepID=UPI0034196FFF
ALSAAFPGVEFRRATEEAVPHQLADAHVYFGVTVDLDTRTLAVGGERFSFAAPRKECPIGERTVTVTAKYPVLDVAPSRLVDHATSRRWSIAFTDRGHHQRLLMFALDPADAPLVGADTVRGALGLAPKDGKRVYDAIELGARVEIKGRQAASASPDAYCVDRRPLPAARVHD